MKKYLLMSILVGSSILLGGCTDENGNNERAMSLLMKAEQNFNEMDSYIETVYTTKKVQDKITQTDVSFRVLDADKDGKYASGKLEEVVLSYPTVVQNKADLLFQVPTKISLKEKSEDGEYQAKEFMSLYEQGEYLPFSEKEYKQKDVMLDKSSIKELVTLASSLQPLQAEHEGINLHAYSGADFHIKAIPSHLKNLEKVKEMKLDDRTYIVLRAEVAAMKDEMFSIYPKAKVEFWIDKKTHTLVKEIYKSSTYDNELKSGMTIYQYGSFDDIPEIKRSKELKSLATQYPQLIDLNEERSSDVLYDITGVPVKEKEKGKKDE